MSDDTRREVRPPRPDTGADAAGANLASLHRDMPRALVTGPSAWLGADLAKRPEDWTYRLSPAEIAEIEAATASVSGRDIAAIRQADFPLPTLGPVMERLRDEVLNGRGFVLIRGLPAENRPIAESAAAYWGIGTYFVIAHPG